MRCCCQQGLLGLCMDENTYQNCSKQNQFIEHCLHSSYGSTIGDTSHSMMVGYLS